MKNELKIAIAICSKLRDSLDKEMRPHSISKEDMEIQVNKSMDYYKTLSPPGFDEEIPKKIFDKFKEIVLQARTEIHKSQKKVYDKILPEIISDAIYSFEEYFKSIYSDEELKEISTFIESETGKKVISDTYVFNELHKYRNHMRDELNEEINRNEATERMNKKISELIVTLSLPDSSNDDYNH